MLYKELKSLEKITTANLAQFDVLTTRKNFFHFVLMKWGCTHLELNKYKDNFNELDIKSEKDGWIFEYCPSPFTPKEPQYTKGSLVRYIDQRYERQDKSLLASYEALRKELLMLESIELIKFPIIHELEALGYLSPECYFYSKVPLNKQLLVNVGIMTRSGTLYFDKTIQDMQAFTDHLKSYEISTIARINNQKVQFTFTFSYRHYLKKINLWEDLYWKNISVRAENINANFHVKNAAIPSPEDLYNHFANPSLNQSRSNTFDNIRDQLQHSKHGTRSAPYHFNISQAKDPK